MRPNLCRKTFVKKNSMVVAGGPYLHGLCDEFLDALDLLHINWDSDGLTAMKLRNFPSYCGDSRLTILELVQGIASICGSSYLLRVRVWRERDNITLIRFTLRRHNNYTDSVS